MNKTTLLKTMLWLLATPLTTAQADNTSIRSGQWSITMNDAKTLTLEQGDRLLLKGVYVKALNAQDEPLVSTDYPDVSLRREPLTDVMGTGEKFTYIYSGLAGKENLEQVFYIYPDRNYLVTEAAIVAGQGTTSTHWIAPVMTSSSVTFLPSEGDNRMYDMPFDNDAWVGYTAHPWSTGQTITSCEVSAFYDVTGRGGLCVGSIEHEDWKTGITASLAGSNRLRSLQIFGGYVSARTNDDRPDLGSVVTRHGSIAGKRVRSPKMFLGYYADWRNGLEDLGEATAMLRPKLKWDKGTVFAWQSWGGMAEKVNYEGAVDVSDFFHEQLMPRAFHNENGTCYMVLDSYWSNLSDEQLRLFVERCKANGQHPGIYTTPFSYWGTPESARTQKPEDVSYTYAEMMLKGNGTYRKIASYALDPTHPGTLEWNRKRLEKFRQLGFEYVKLDFINNGALEADHFYAPGITTGMQAYTYGMNKILEMAGDMFVDLSIAPVFPAVGHARRISCDAWGERSFTQYSLNNIGMGWWLDRVYPYNDPDHLVLQRSEDEAAARMRYTCGVMTGTVLLGDNYSLKGSFVGTQAYRDRALKTATNAAVNKVAWIGRSFRPVEGGQSAGSFSLWDKTYQADNEFMLDTEEALYYVCFNAKSEAPLSKAVVFSRLGIAHSEVKDIEELWTGSIVAVGETGFTADVPAGDVRLYKINKTQTTAINTVARECVQVTCSGKTITCRAGETIDAMRLYSADGRLQMAGHPRQTVGVLMPVHCRPGVYLLHLLLASGKTTDHKVVIG